MKKRTWVALLLFLLLAFLANRLYKKSGISGNQIVTNPPAADFLVATDGEKITGKDVLPRPVAVMVENHPDARPQSGLGYADIVYEALTEGGITRFMALYQSKVPENIGPVRSAREYFAQIADEWGAVYAHVGGSNQVIAQLKNGDYQRLSDANQYYNGDFFTRVPNKPAPHDVFTSIDKLNALLGAHGFSNAVNYEPWQFKDDSPAALPDAADIKINFSTSEYAVEWKYDAAADSYLRFLAGTPHKDAFSGTQLSAKTVVAQLVKVTPWPKDPLLHVDIDLSSGGKAEIFLDGRVIIGTWKKVNGRTRYYGTDGQEISFNRGPVWVELVPDGQDVTWH